MSNKNDLNNELNTILNQLRILERTLNNSINHTEETNLTYPIVSQRYNQLLNRIKKLAETNPPLKMIIEPLDNFEEKDFLPSGNYRYAVNLQTTIRILHSDLSNLGFGRGLEKAMDAATRIVFISYATEEIELAYFIEKVLQRWVDNKIEIFIAKRDLKSSDAWVKVMEEKLKTAYCIIPICSNIAKKNPWVWWESAAVWGANNKVHPLFTNISPEEFGQPLTLFVQGKNYFHKDEFVSTLVTVCKQLMVEVRSAELTEEELTKFAKLSEKYIKVKTSDSIEEKESGEVEINYEKISTTQALHEYSLIFNVINKSKKKFDDVALRLYFPSDYLVKTEWNYPHLQSSVSADMPGYLCLTFDFSALPEDAKKQFSKCLLPGEKLKIFGENGISRLRYQMDRSRYGARIKYNVQWEMYVNGEASGKGSRPLDSIHIF